MCKWITLLYTWNKHSYCSSAVLQYKIKAQRLPWRLSAEESMCHAGDTSDPWSGKIQMPRSNCLCHNRWVCVPEPKNHNYWCPRALGPILWDKSSHCNEKPTHHKKEPLLTVTREKAAQQWRPSTAKNEINKITFNFKKMKKLQTSIQ